MPHTNKPYRHSKTNVYVKRTANFTRGIEAKASVQTAGRSPGLCINAQKGLPMHSTVTGTFRYSVKYGLSSLLNYGDEFVRDFHPTSLFIESNSKMSIRHLSFLIKFSMCSTINNHITAGVFCQGEF